MTTDEQMEWPAEIMVWTTDPPDDYPKGEWDSLAGAENPERPSMEYVRKDRIEELEAVLTEIAEGLTPDAWAAVKAREALEAVK